MKLRRPGNLVFFTAVGTAAAMQYLDASFAVVFLVALVIGTWLNGDEVREAERDQRALDRRNGLGL